MSCLEEVPRAPAIVDVADRGRTSFIPSTTTRQKLWPVLRNDMYLGILKLFQTCMVLMFCKQQNAMRLLSCIKQLAIIALTRFQKVLACFWGTRGVKDDCMPVPRFAVIPINEMTMSCSVSCQVIESRSWVPLSPAGGWRRCGVPIESSFNEARVSSQ